MSRLAPLLVLLATGCDGGGKDDTADTADSADTGDTTETADTADTADSEDTSDTEDSGDTADTGDTAPVGDDGLLSWNGGADVDGHWLGWESVVFQENMGLGDVLCEIRYPVEDVGPRDDCAECEVAFDVQLGAGEVLLDERCAAAGEDASTIAAREGEVRGYGFALNYLGHSNVLMYDDAGVWKAVAFVDWDEEALTLTYAWEQAVISY